MSRYDLPVIPYLHRLTAVLFYLFAGSFFAAYLLFYNGIGGAFPKWWLMIGDLPLALVAIIYGGTSLYLSVKPKNGDSGSLLMTIFIPLTMIFSALVVMNFWPLWAGQ